jgi:hypothetical protein
MSRRTPVLGLGIAVLIAGAYAYRQQSLARTEESTANFRLLFDTPQGWMPVPHSPQALFLFKNPGSKLLMRGAMNDVVAEYNPTPELDRDGLAKYMLDVTDLNLKDWRGSMLGTVSAQGTSFRLIKRWSPQKCVVSAVAVRGNTSVVVTLSGNQRQAQSIDQALPEFRSYLSTLGMERRYYENL